MLIFQADCYNEPLNTTTPNVKDLLREFSHETEMTNVDNDDAYDLESCDLASTIAGASIMLKNNSNDDVFNFNNTASTSQVRKNVIHIFFVTIYILNSTAI